MHVNKVSHVRTIDRVAKELGEDVDWLFDVALEMEPEDGVIWVQGLDDESIMAFTDFGVESLVDLIKIRRETIRREERSNQPRAPAPAAHAGRLRFIFPDDSEGWRLPSSRVNVTRCPKATALNSAGGRTT